MSEPAPRMAESTAAESPDSARARMSAEARRAVVGELQRLLTYMVLGLLPGWWLGHPAAGVAVALLLYVIGHLRQLRVLRKWVDMPKRFDLPEPGGIWGEIFESLLTLQISHRKRKKRLAAILAEFQASTAALPDGAVVLGEQGEIVWFNKSAQTLLGLHAAQDLGIRIANLIRHPKFTEYLAHGDFDGEVEAPSPINLHATLALRLIPYGNNQRLLIVRDISELRMLETARRDFVANASHELRTPLTVLRGYLDMLEPEAASGGPLDVWRGPISEMRAQAARMSSLIEDMLKLARLESSVYDTRHEVVSVAAILKRVVDDESAQSKGQHRLELSCDPNLRLQGRETELQSIFANLVSNAVRYTPAGGSVRVQGWVDSEGAHVSVTDSGIGIAEKDIPRLTERFYRVDVGRSRASGGTGLGLSIVKHALERHEGTMTISSRPGQGSTFTCHFPPNRVPLISQNMRDLIA